jgi:hypothetical protein
MLEHELEQDADDVVVHRAKPLSAAAALAVLQQKLFDVGAACVQHLLQPLCHRTPQLLLGAGVLIGELGEFVGECALVEGGMRGMGASMGLIEREHRPLA